MKLIGISLILLGCTMSGFVIDAWEKKRIKELEQFIYIFEILKRDIDYQLTPLKEACEAAVKFASYEVGGIFEQFAMQMSLKNSWDIEEMWQESLAHRKGKLHLKDEDYSILQQFGKACGYLDKQMQERNIEMVIEALRVDAIESKKHYEKTTTLNKYIGFFVGACISIFLI